MSKANSHTSTPEHPDAALLAAIAAHDKLWSEWDALAEVDEDDPRISAISARPRGWPA